MKIGILTQRLFTNYGGLLQNYALQQVLKRMGHEVETLDQQRKHTFGLDFKKKAILFAAQCLKPAKLGFPGQYVTQEELCQIRKYTDYFIDKYISRTHPLSKRKDFPLIAGERNYDAYIVGSDQCWRQEYNDFLPAMFLDFVENRSNVKRIAYAASFGTDDWELSDSMTKECARLVQLFDLVTVREETGIGLCKKHFGVNATQVLDPTMLLTIDDYKKLIEGENEPESEGSLFYYILDPSEYKKSVINKAGRDMNLVPFTVMPKYSDEYRTVPIVKNHLSDCVYPPVTKWLRAFLDAKITIVDSFHGAVFSIIFNKPFWIIGNKERGMARFNSLLKMFGLESRMLEELDINRVDFHERIDWNNINSMIEQNKAKSIDLLNRCL